jgi:lipopolysaccharide transport system permease protein
VAARRSARQERRTLPTGFDDVATGGHTSLRPVATAAQRELVIRPPHRWTDIGLREIWEYRELLYFMTKRELQIRYKQSIFGVSWAVLQPLVYAFVFALFFGQLAAIPSDGFPYPVFALAALVPWMYVSQAVSQGAGSLVADSNLLSKVYFPRLIIPIAKILSLLVDLAIALCVLMLLVLVYGASPSIGLLALPFFIALALFTCMGMASGLGALNVMYRDVTVAIPLLIQLWLFASPIAYPASLIPGEWEYVYALNPMVSVIDGSRWAFLGADPPDAGIMACSLAGALLLLAAGILYFRRTERFFADVV